MTNELALYAATWAAFTPALAAIITTPIRRHRRLRRHRQAFNAPHPKDTSR